MSLSTFAAAQLLRALPRVRISRAVGRWCDRPLSGRVAGTIVRAYSRAYGVNLDEAEPRAGGYPSFDAFFTRSLRAGARSIRSDVVVGPAGGRLSVTVKLAPR